MTKNLALPTEMMTLVQKAQRRFSAIAKKNGGLVNWQTEKNFANQIIAASPTLQKCVPESITNSIVNVAAIGLSLNPQRKHCALIPRYDTKLGMFVCHADPMYQGIIAIGTETESITSCWVDVVREGDQRQGNFSYQGGTSPRVHFSPNPFESPEARGPIIGAFCIAEIPGATEKKVTFMRIEKILAIRDKYSEAWKYKIKKERENPGRHFYGGPWEDAEEEMIKKTVIKRAAKTWPKKSARLDQAIDLSNQAETVIQRRDTDIEVEAVEVISKKQASEIKELANEAHVSIDKILRRFTIKKIGDLPAESFDQCISLLRHSKLIYILRTATEETEVCARDHGITFEQLEGLAADEKSKAKLFSGRNE